MDEGPTSGIPVCYYHGHTLPPGHLDQPLPGIRIQKVLQYEILLEWAKQLFQLERTRILIEDLKM